MALTASILGGGVQNTADIVGGCADPSAAAKQADDYVYNGYDDWHLPSVGELIKLWESKANGNADLTAGLYWSSSEVDAESARTVGDFGGRYTLAKSESHYVRAVRRFEVPRE